MNDEENVSESCKITASELRLSQLADEFMAACERGAEPRVEDYATQLPDLADVIRSVFPALSLIRSGDGSDNPRTLQLQELGHQLGDFRLIREIGRGGMGIVYEAEEMSLGRRVALKILPFASLLDSRQLQRFKNEARAAALLKHPHIVTIYSVGYERGVHFFAMEYVDGTNLTQLIGTHRDRDPSSPQGPREDDSQTQSTTETARIKDELLSTVNSRGGRAKWQAIAQLGVQAAKALEHAHAHDVIHRDIKPSNLLLDLDGKLFISDFGLARIQTDAGLTVSGDILGTLRYMSPEQLNGSGHVDARTDIYSLGLTLYELVARRPAYCDSSRELLIRNILESDPPFLRRMHRDVPRDFETIIHKAIAKEAHLRYTSAGELAADLERFLQFRPILAHRVSAWTRVLSWCRRRPGFAALLAFVISLLILLAIGGPMVAWRQFTLKEQSQRHLYVADMNLAYRAWYAGNVDEARRLIFRHAPETNTRKFDFARNYLQTKLEQAEEAVLSRHRGPVAAIAIAPSDQFVASAGSDRVIRFTDLFDGRLVRELRGHKAPVRALAFNSDATRLVSGGEHRALLIWNTADWTAQAASDAPPADVNKVSIAPDGQSFVAGLADGTVGLWSLDGKLRWSIPAHSEGITQVAFAPDGRSIASSAASDPVIRRWDALSGMPLRDLATLPHLAFGIAFASDHGCLLTNSPMGVQFWDLEAGKELQGLFYSTRPISTMAVGPQGVLATGGWDGLIMLWDIASRYRMATVIGHRGDVSSLAFTPDARLLVSGGSDGTVRRFDLSEVHQYQQRLPEMDLNRNTTVAISADGSALVSVTANWESPLFAREAGKLTQWDPETGQAIYEMTLDCAEGAAVAVLPGGRLVATGGPSGVRVWNLKNRRIYRALDSIPTYNVAFSHDGKWLAALGTGVRSNDQHVPGHLRIWDLTWRQPVTEMPTLAEFSSPKVMQFTSDSQSLWCAGGPITDRRLQSWKLQNRQWKADDSIVSPVSGMVSALEVLPGCSKLLLSSHDGELTLFDLQAHRNAWAVHATSQQIFCSAIASDGKLCATGSDRVIQLWDARSGDRIATLDVYMTVTSLVFTRDGKVLVWGSGDGTVNFERATAFRR